MGFWMLTELVWSVSISMLRELGGWVSLSMLSVGLGSLVMQVLILFDLLKNLSLANTSWSFGTKIVNKP